MDSQIAMPMTRGRLLPVTLALLLASGARAARTRTVVAGGNGASYLYGKLQRVAALPGATLDDPVALARNTKPLEKVLWGQFGMATVSYSVPPDRVDAAGDLSGALWFVDALPAEAPAAAPAFALPALPNPFAKPRKTPAPPAAAPAAARGGMPAAELADLAAAARRSGAARCYVFAADAADCDDAFRGGPPRTVFAPAAGVAAASTPGWEAVRTQDDLGDLTAALGLSLDAGFGAGGAVAREDLAEVVLQSALRAPRDGGDVTIYYAPGGALVERANENYFGKDGVVSSMDWDAAFAGLAPPAEADA